MLGVALVIVMALEAVLEMAAVAGGQFPLIECYCTTVICGLHTVSLFGHMERPQTLAAFTVGLAPQDKVAISGMQVEVVLEAGFQLTLKNILSNQEGMCKLTVTP